MEASLFRPYSIGYVAENKPRNDSICYVAPVESRAALDGTVGIDPVVQSQKWSDSEGNVNEVKTTSSNTIACHWLPTESNRATPPDVVVGEKVMIYKNADDDNGYYWSSLGLDSGLRQEETYILMVGATKDKSGYGKDFSKAYCFMLSGHDKHITLMTSKANGEPFKYTFQINGGAGEFFLMDDIENLLHLDSKNKKWTLKNADNSQFILDKRKISISADEEIQLVCGGSNITLKPDNIQVKTNQWLAGVTGNTNWTTAKFNVI